MNRRVLPRGMSFWHPCCLAGTWFGTGLLPVAPGTWGSLAALPFAWYITAWAGPWGLLAAVAAIFALGWFVSEIYVRRSQVDDPGSLVIDEVAGQWLVLTLAPLDMWFYAAAFILFRIVDILKPWPARWADRSLKGGLGVMLDDILACPLALAALYVLILLFEGHAVP